MTSVLHLLFCWNENNGILPELSEIKLKPSSMHTLQKFTALLEGTLLGRETIETHSSPLSEFIHSTRNHTFKTE
jgi:hypothetical protein